jgi:hypothetical protein
MKSTLLAVLIVFSTFASAATVSRNEKITIETFESTNEGLMKIGTDVNGAGGGGEVPRVDRVERAGEIIAKARDFVALGESIYTLVQKGKPTTTTEYAPISVVPKDPISKEVVEPFDLEGFSMPVQKKFTTIIKSGLSEAIRFDYMVTYSYGGSYNGVGKWLTGVQIIPVSVKTSYGWDFNATMKVSGIMNHGTKADPIAGVIVIVKYQMNSWRTSQERNDTFHITGLGELKTFINNK